MIVETLRRYKKWFLIAGMLCCAAAIVYTVNPRIKPFLLERGLSYIVTPLQTGASRISRWADKQYTALTDARRVFNENKALKEENLLLQLENERLRLTDETNKRLSELLNIGQKYPALPMQGAEVIGKAPAELYDSFNVDKGESHGIYRNMAVLGAGGDAGGLLGVVREVYPLTSQVISITDHRFSVAVVCERTGDMGVLKGDAKLLPQGLCRLDYIDAGAQIMEGDVLSTSDHGAIFPPGIRVGTITNLGLNPDGVTRYAIVEPFADTHGIQTVLIVKRVYAEEDRQRDELMFIEE